MPIIHVHQCCIREVVTLVMAGVSAQNGQIGLELGNDPWLGQVRLRMADLKKSMFMPLETDCFDGLNLRGYCNG